MTQEEKARRYDEAIKRAKELLEIGVKDTRDKRVVLSFFPELKESEDEKIRKGLIAIITDFESLYLQENYALSKEDALAWLEKQGQTFTKKDVDDAYLKGVCDTKHELERQGEQKPTENKGMNLVEEEMTPFQKKVFCIIDTTIEEEQGLKQVCDELFALAFNEIEKKPAAWRGTRLTI